MMVREIEREKPEGKDGKPNEVRMYATVDDRFGPDLGFRTSSSVGGG